MYYRLKYFIIDKSLGPGAGAPMPKNFTFHVDGERYFNDEGYRTMNQLMLKKIRSTKLKKSEFFMIDSLWQCEVEDGAYRLVNSRDLSNIVNPLLEEIQNYMKKSKK